ncbi:MAG: glycosyltransferase [Nigerium sp.]|nr:glycosyltransferase [Nigerium sp.]
MDHCIDSILRGRGDIEIIIVNDGSTRDDTAERADRWAAQYPGVIKVIHQENKGHGGAVMAGLREASGVYFKVVDSDDWLDPVALNLMLSKLRHFISSGSPVDLVVANYVYEHTNSGTQKVIRYRHMMPKNRIFTWNELGFSGPGQNILMHSATFRTQILRDSGVELPEHTFYVDNIFVYVPLPSVQTLYYLPVNLYRYFIGRDDQSVNESVQVSRLDQQMRVTRIMVEAHKLPEGAGNRRLAGYMEQYLGLIVTASSMFALLEGTEKGTRMRREMWEHIDAIDPILKHRLGLRLPLVLGANLPGRIGRSVSVALYRTAQKLYRFS